MNREIVERRIRIFEKSYTLPAQLNAVQRNQNNFYAKNMEILSENEQNHKEMLPLALGNIPNDTKSTPNHTQDKPNELKHQEYLPQVSVTNKVCITVVYV